MVRDLIILIVISIVIAVIKNLIPKGSMEMMKDSTMLAVITITMTMKNSIKWDFTVSAKIIRMVAIIAILQENTDSLSTVSAILDIRHQKEILLGFYNGSNYGYRFIIKQLPEQFEDQFECLVENTEKYITFSVPIIKKENRKTTQYKIRFIDSVKFMASFLLNLADNIAEGLRKGKRGIVSQPLHKWQPNMVYWHLGQKHISYPWRH